MYKISLSNNCRCISTGVRWQFWDLKRNLNAGCEHFSCIFCHFVFFSLIGINIQTNCSSRAPSPFIKSKKIFQMMYHSVLLCTPGCGFEPRTKVPKTRPPFLITMMKKKSKSAKKPSVKRFPDFLTIEKTLFKCLSISQMNYHEGRLVIKWIFWLIQSCSFRNFWSKYVKNSSSTFQCVQARNFNFPTWKRKTIPFCPHCLCLCGQNGIVFPF